MRSDPLRLFVATLVAAFVQTAIAEAKGWAEAIKEVEERAEFLWDYGLDRGASAGLGSIYNELHADHHRCAIAGRILGREDNIRHLEEMPEPILSEKMNDDQLAELMLYSHSLSNWVIAAKRLTVLPMEEVAEIWNLNCVGKLDIDETAFVGVGIGAARFKQDGDRMMVLGDIEIGFADELKTWLRTYPETTEVVLGSGGGSVSDAIVAGISIREAGLDTTLSDSCFSACPLVFLGGVNRGIWSPYPSLGFHQVFTGDGQPVPISSEIYQTILEYSQIMGVDGNFVVNSMLRASPSEMFEPDIMELCEARVVTWVQRICF